MHAVNPFIPTVNWNPNKTSGHSVGQLARKHFTYPFEGIIMWTYLCKLSISFGLGTAFSVKMVCILCEFFPVKEPLEQSDSYIDISNCVNENTRFSYAW